MTKKAKLFGYWAYIYDAQTAQQAVRMAGLPMLIVGVNSGLLALLTLTSEVPSVTLASAYAILAILLIILAFRMRAGAAAWVPLSTLLYMCFIAASAYTSYVAWQIAKPEQFHGARIVFSWIIPIICAVLSVGGFRGWRWLRSNDVKTKF